jgi:hypothetical protein
LYEIIIKKDSGEHSNTKEYLNYYNYRCLHLKTTHLFGNAILQQKCAISETAFMLHRYAVSGHLFLAVAAISLKDLGFLVIL